MNIRFSEIQVQQVGQRRPAVGQLPCDKRVVKERHHRHHHVLSDNSRRQIRKLSYNHAALHEIQFHPLQTGDVLPRAEVRALSQRGQRGQRLRERHQEVAGGGRLLSGVEVNGAFACEFKVAGRRSFGGKGARTRAPRHEQGRKEPQRVVAPAQRTRGHKHG